MQSCGLTVVSHGERPRLRQGLLRLRFLLLRAPSRLAEEGDGARRRADEAGDHPWSTRAARRLQQLGVMNRKTVTKKGSTMDIMYRGHVVNQWMCVEVDIVMLKAP